MLGLTEAGIHARVPEHLRDVALRLYRLGYGVSYRVQRPAKSRKSVREVIDAIDEEFVQLRLTVIWPDGGDPILVPQGATRDERRSQVKLSGFTGMDEFWSFAENRGSATSFAQDQEG